jgi:hypothetical protein
VVSVGTKAARSAEHRTPVLHAEGGVVGQREQIHLLEWVIDLQLLGQVPEGELGPFQDELTLARVGYTSCMSEREAERERERDLYIYIYIPFASRRVQ